MPAPTISRRQWISTLRNYDEPVIPGGRALQKAFTERDADLLAATLAQYPQAHATRMAMMGPDQRVKYEGLLPHFAVLIGWDEGLDVLARSGANLSMIDPATGATVMETAVAKGRVRIVKKLLGMGVVPWQQGRESPLLQMPAGLVAMSKKTAIANALIKAGVDRWKAHGDAKDTMTTVAYYLLRQDLPFAAFLAAEGQANPKGQRTAIGAWLGQVRDPGTSTQDQLQMMEHLLAQGWVPPMKQLISCLWSKKSDPTMLAILQRRMAFPVSPQEAAEASKMLAAKQSPGTEPLQAELDRVVLNETHLPAARGRRARM